MITDEQLKGVKAILANADGGGTCRFCSGKGWVSDGRSPPGQEECAACDGAGNIGIAAPFVIALIARLELAESALRDLQLDSDAAREALRLRSENVQLRRGLERISTHDGSGAQSAYCEFSIEMARKILGGEP